MNNKARKINLRWECQGENSFRQEHFKQEFGLTKQRQLWADWQLEADEMEYFKRFLYSTNNSIPKGDLYVKNKN